MAEKKTPTYKALRDFLRLTVGTYFRLRYRLRAENLKELRHLPKPWLMLPNHVMTWDPVLIGIHITDPIFFIASDANFRSPFASRWLKRLGAVPTSKQATDFTTLRQIVKLLSEGRHVGVFPEGERTWDGVTMPIIPATAKLVRLAKASVVVPVLKGAYQCRPRWAVKSRLGPVTIEYRVALRRDELETLSLEEIHRRIQETLHHDDHRYQLEQKAVYETDSPAEPLQAVLFACPSCRSLNTLEGRQDLLTCRSCGWETQFTVFGSFEQSGSHPHYYDNIRQWNLWQLEELERQIESRRERNDESPLFSDTPAVHSTGYKVESLEEQGRGTVSLSIRGITFAPEEGSAAVHFPWEEITALNVVYQSQIEFYREKTLHSFIFPGKDISGYKYLCAGRIIQGTSGQR
ncbi:MAG: 1-acyl-sn-glycerol-3-phosphate acyltransferase [Spirochaetales bacterium]|nr:1-acyl-sn-glycerol-3-phosphate acyltransferase [Spirochaetales bacterium]